MAVDAKVSLTRLYQFLQAEDLKRMDENEDLDTGSVLISEPSEFVWNPAQKRPVIRDIALDVKPGELVLVIGKVGSGKSTLLSGILNELTQSPAPKYANFSGKVAYVSQVAWIMNLTVRENILFGNPYDEKKYKRAVVKKNIYKRERYEIYIICFSHSLFPPGEQIFFFLNWGNHKKKKNEQNLAFEFLPFPLFCVNSRLLSLSGV